MEKFIKSVIKSIENSNNQKTRRMLKVIKSSLGLSRLMQSRIDDLNELLKKENIVTEPILKAGISDETNITFRFIDSNQLALNNISDESNLFNDIIENQTKASLIIGDDFFKHLFDFESEQEYERFQASLDSNSPMAIFIIPKKENFYSGIIDRILSFEVIRKRQYQGKGSKVGNISPKKFISPNENILEGLIIEDNTFNFWTGCDIHSFSDDIMREVILAESGQDLIHSNDFNNRLNQLALYSNKYYSNDLFFVLFNCPDIQLIKQNERMLALVNLVDKVSLSLPNTFKLICKFDSDAELAKNEIVRNQIIDHFKVLFEIPQYSNVNAKDDISNIFSDFQKIQRQLESQLMHNIDPEIFPFLKWGFESEEHIYLKYFSIKTLKKYYGYSLESIISEKSEQFIDENTSEDYNSRPDVKAENSTIGNIIVEVETMRGKSYLNMIGEIVNKAKGWQSDKKLKELWLVVPGFEIARNYYQLQTFQKISSASLQKIFGREISCKVFAPDYSKQEIFEVNLNRTEKQLFDIDAKSNSGILELERAIANEDYENASKIRDSMNDMINNS